MYFGLVSSERDGFHKAILQSTSQQSEGLVGGEARILWSYARTGRGSHPSSRKPHVWRRVSRNVHTAGLQLPVGFGNGCSHHVRAWQARPRQQADQNRGSQHFEDVQVGPRAQTGGPSSSVHAAGVHPFPAFSGRSAGDNVCDVRGFGCDVDARDAREDRMWGMFLSLWWVIPECVPPNNTATRTCTEIFWQRFDIGRLLRTGVGQFNECLKLYNRAQKGILMDALMNAFKSVRSNGIAF